MAHSIVFRVSCNSHLPMYIVLLSGVLWLHHFLLGNYFSNNKKNLKTIQFKVEEEGKEEEGEEGKEEEEKK